MTQQTAEVETPGGFSGSIPGFAVAGFLALLGYLLYKQLQAVGGAGRAFGDTASGVTDWTGRTVADGSVDAARGTGDVVGNVVDSAGQIFNETAGGAADVADRLNPTTSGAVIPGQVWF